MDAQSIPVVDASPTTEPLPSMSEFVKQAEEAQKCLRQFVCVKDLKDCDNIIVPALHRLVKETVSFYFHRNISVFSTYNYSQLLFKNFTHLVEHPLFQETVPAVRKAIDSLELSNPHIEIPKNFGGIKGLEVRVHNQLGTPAKKGKAVAFFILFLLY